MAQVGAEQDLVGQEAPEQSKIYRDSRELGTGEATEHTE